MNKEQLEQVLFSKRTRVFAVLDGASIPGLPMKIHEMKPPHHCLYRGELAPDLAEVMPYLVVLVPNTPFSDWFLSENFGKHWGIFAHCHRSLKEMRRHFRALFTVYNDKGDPMIFRYYDPRVLDSFLQTCNAGELKTFFGDVQTFFSEDKQGEGFYSFSLQNDELRKIKLN